MGIVLVILALALIVSIAPLLRWRATLSSDGDRLSVLGLVLSLMLGARALLWLAPVRTLDASGLHTEALGAPLRALLRSPLDFLLTLLLFASLVMLGFDFAERIRHMIRHRHAAPAGAREWTLFGISQITTGVLVALLLVGYEVMLGNAISATSVDALHFSLHPWSYSRGVADCLCHRGDPGARCGALGGRAHCPAGVAAVEDSANRNSGSRRVSLSSAADR
jgi:hypothetical protein